MTANDLSNCIILRSVFGKVGQKYFIQPCKDPRTGLYPACVKRVNSQGDMILTDSERNSGEYFIPETKVYVIEDGKTFNLDNEIDRKDWEAIKNCVFIAPSRDAKDAQGNNLIDGTMGWTNHKPRYGQAELYVYNPEADTHKRVSRKDLLRKALNFIYDDPKGAHGRMLIARLFGRDMSRQSDNDVTDYLVSKAENDPAKVCQLYTGDDTQLRLLFLDARDNKVIINRNKIYSYNTVSIAMTDEAVITWMKDPKNRKVLELIKRDTYPDLYADDEVVEKKTK